MLPISSPISSPPQDRRPIVRKVLVITLILNLAVVLLKAMVGWWTGSLSLWADALHSVTDSVNNVLGLIASQMAAPEPDREHPYGHQKFEAIGALVIASFLGIACFEILQSAFQRLIPGNSQPITISSQELWILLLVLGINIFVAFYERRVGLQVGSPILIADAQHTMSDIWVTISVLAGLIGIWIWQLTWLDVVISFPVALMVFFSGWSVLKENLPWLVDQMAIAPEVIHQIVMDIPGVVNCHDVASRGVVGRQVFIEMHLVVAAMDVETAHEITERVEKALESRYQPVRVIIHVEPPALSSPMVSYKPTR